MRLNQHITARILSRGSKNLTKRIVCLICSCALALATSAASAQVAVVKPSPQSGAGGIGGTVVDPTGSSIQNANVAVTDEATGRVIKTATNQQGRFSVAGLTAGKYAVEVSAQGFALDSRTVQVAGDGTEEIAVALKLGDLSEAVIVDATDSDSVAARLAPMANAWLS